VRQVYDDTLVIFTSDHGEYLGFHHLLLKDGPMYDPLVKVPLLVKFPARHADCRQNEADGALDSLIDLGPHDPRPMWRRDAHAAGDTELDQDLPPVVVMGLSHLLSLLERVAAWNALESVPVRLIVERAPPQR
jgi:hypothetical protein